MNIKFGTTLDNVTRAMFISVTLLSFICGTYLIHNKLDDAQVELYRSRIDNITLFNIRLFCNMSFDDCLCSVQSTRSKQLKYCLTENFLLAAVSFSWSHLYFKSFLFAICFLSVENMFLLLFTVCGSFPYF